MTMTTLMLSAALGGAALAQTPPPPPPEPPPPSAMVVLDNSGSGALSMVGNSTVQIPTQAVYVNSSSTTAVTTSGACVLDAPYLYVIGGVDFTGGSRCTGEVISAVAPYVDPFGGAVFPATQGMTDLGRRTITSDTTLTPGYYGGGIRISGNADVALEPGLYVIGGDGLRLSSGSISGHGVCLAVYAGVVDMGGASSMALTPPEDGPYAGLTIVQPSFNPVQMTLAGGGEVNISGGIYNPGGSLTLVGTSEVQGEGPQMGDVVVAGRVTLRGTSIIRIGRPGSPPLRLPMTAAFD